MMPAALHLSTEHASADVTPTTARREDRAGAVSRVLAIDYAKAIGISLVVFGHVWRGLVNAGIIHPGDGYGWIDRWIYAFHMPLFFFLAGLFIERAVSRPLTSVLANKAATLLYPYVIWTVLQAVIGSFLGGFTNREFSLAELPRVLLFHPYSPFWFLYVLFMAEVIFVMARKMAVPLWVLLAAGLVLRWPAEGFTWVPGMYFATMFVYLVAGAMFSATVLRVTAQPSARAWATAVAAGAAMTALVQWADVRHPATATAAAGLGIVMVLGLAVGTSALSGMKFLAVLGGLSLQIFLMHVLCTSGCRVILHRVGHIETPWLHLAAGMACGILGPILFWRLTRHVGGEWLFRPPTRTDARRRPVFS